MRPQTLTIDFPLASLRRETRFTLAVVRTRPFAAAHVPIFEADLKAVAACEAELATLQDLQEDAQAQVSEADRNLDHFIMDTSIEARRVIGNDTDAPLWQSLFGSQTPSVMVRPKLGEELEKARNWPKVLAASSSPELQKRALKCTALIAAADAAIESVSDAQSALKVFKSAKLVALLSRLNDSRIALSSDTERMAIAGKIRDDETQGLFRLATRARPARPETLVDLRAEVTEAEQALAQLQKRVKELEAAELAAHQLEEQHRLHQEAIKAARAAHAETAAKLAALEKQLKP
jgi:hypothetical protein